MENSLRSIGLRSKSRFILRSCKAAQVILVPGYSGGGRAGLSPASRPPVKTPAAPNGLSP